MKKNKQIEDQRVAAGIVTDVLLELKALTKPDVSLDMLDELAERMIRERGGTPYNKGYKPSWSESSYPSTICASVDYEVCHAPPAGRILKTGSIVKYDLGVKYKTGCGDAALTVAVGDINNRKQRAMRYGLEALYEGIKVVKAGLPISTIGRVIEDFCSMHGYQIIKEFGGHSIGKEMHESPHIPHYYDSKYDSIFLEEGKIICLEPMCTPGKGKVAINMEDKWTAFLVDRQPCVMFEEMIEVTREGCNILTNHLTK